MTKKLKSAVILVETMWQCRCGHIWLSRVAEPKKCPKCGKLRWGRRATRKSPGTQIAVHGPIPDSKK